MKKALPLVYLFSMLFLSQLWAQERSISGTVTSTEDDSALPGVNVILQGSTIGTTTDIEGHYRLNVPESGGTLLFSFIGLATEEVEIGSRSVIDVAMDPDLQQLQEVVVVGYGTQLKQNLTGNIAQISGEEIENIPVPSFESAIQGRAAGVFVESSSGKLGQGIKMRIRGSSSVTANNQPLYVIDGIPLTTQSFSNNGAETNPLADINFNDIASIDVLKDASAAAIYGARGSNGVVLITTKKGQAGKTNFNVNYFGGVSEPTRKREFLNAGEYVGLYLEAAERAAIYEYNQDPGAWDNDIQLALDDYQGFVEGRLDRYAGGTDWRQALTGNPEVDANWQDEAFQTGGIQQIDINASGGNEKTRFYISGHFSDQNGIILRNDFKRYSGRINLDHAVSDRLKIGVNMSLAKTINNRLSNDNSFANPIQLVAQPPIQPIIDPATGDINNNTLYFNGLLYVDNAFFTTEVFRNLSNVYGSYEIIPGLTFRSEFGLDLLTQNEEEYYGRKTFRNIGFENGLGANRWVQAVNYTTNNFFSFNKSINEVHNLETVLGMSYQEATTNVTSVEGITFPNDAFRQIASAAEISSGTSTETAYSFLSYFARANYNFKQKYLLSLSGRVDASSRFGADNKYGFFPAASAGWIISEESFLDNINTISFLKIRASYGLTGNAEIDNFASRGLYEGTAYAGVSGIYPSQIPNPDLKWETTTQTDIGIDFGFLNDRVTGELDYYVKNTNDLLLNVNVPLSVGFSTVYGNVGSLENKGVEIVLNTQNLVGEFTWSTSFNFSRNRNKITDLDGSIIEGGYVNRAVEGEPLGVFYTVEYAGVDPANGDALYYINDPENLSDRSTTNFYGDANRVVVGDPNPDFIAGISNNFSFKGIDLSVLFQGVYGNDIFQGGGSFMSSNANWFDNQTKDQLRRWQEPGDITDVPEARLGYDNGIGSSSRYITDGSYLRLKTVTLGYTLPQNISELIKMQKVRIYVSGQNLLTFTGYEGWDPEVNADYISGNISQGNDFYSAPQSRTITAGINIGF